MRVFICLVLAVLLAGSSSRALTGDHSLRQLFAVMGAVAVVTVGFVAVTS